MRRRIFVFLIALVLVALAATAFVACDPKGQTGTGGLLGEEQETFTEVVTPDYLKVLNPTTQAAQAFPADFSVADITYQVVYNVETKSDLTGKTVSEAERYGELFTATADMLSAESLENLNHPGTHTVTLTLVVDGVSVSGETKVYLKDSAIPTHLVTVNYKAAGGEDKVVAKNIKEDSVLPYGASFLRKFGISSSYVDADGVTQYLAYFDIAGQDANFSPDDLTALTVTSPVTLTADYFPEKKPSYTVTYVTAAPADIIWSDGNAPAPETRTAFVAQGGTVSEIRNDPEFRSDNYTLVGWVKEDGTAFNFASDRVYSDTVITAKWQKRTFKASVSLSGGSFDAGYEASDLQGLSEVKTESVFDVSGKLTGVTFTGIEYGRALSEFYASILLDKEGTAVLTVPLTVLFDAALSPIVRSGYELDGIYNGENAYTVGAAVTRALSLIAHWTPDTSSIDEDYFENTFEFEKLIDGTYAITRVKDARAALVYVPAEYKGLPVTRIEANAAKDNSSVTTLDLTAASNLTYIGANAFGGCVSLSEIRSDAATSKLSRIEAGAFDGINYDLRTNGHLIVGKVLVLANTNGGEVVLSSEPFEYIAGGAFSDTNLTKLVLPDDLKGIADGAFAAANPTGEIAIVAHTTSMEYLGSDIGLASFSDGFEDNMLAIGNALYRYTGDDASVTSVTLENNGLDITVIAGGAFADSPSVTELVKTTADKDIVYIGEDAFHENFVAAHTDENGLFVYDGILVKYYGSAKQVTLTDEVRVINTGAFKNAGLSNLIIPSGSALEHIKTGAFRNAGGLNITVRAKESAADINFDAEVSAFTNWNGAVYVEYRPDRNTSGTPGMSTQALYDSLVNDSANSAMWQWLADNARGRVKFLRDGHYSADWDAVCQTGDLDPKRLQQPRNIHRGRFTLGVRVGGKNDLLGVLIRDALHQLANADIVRPDVPHGRQRAVQHMVQALVFLGSLERDHVARLRDHADGLLVACLIRADRAGLAVRQILAALAGEGARLGVADRVREALRVLLGQVEHIKRQPLRGFLADAGQSGEFLDQPLDRRCEKVHQNRPPPSPPMPPVMADIWFCDFSPAALSASFTAATTRSCSISISSGSTTSGLISMLLSVEVPVTVAVTIPPPAVPVVSIWAISSCALSMFCCIFCACFILACMFLPPPKPPP